MTFLDMFIFHLLFFDVFPENFSSQRCASIGQIFLTWKVYSLSNRERNKTRGFRPRPLKYQISGPSSILTE